MLIFNGPPTPQQLHQLGAIIQLQVDAPAPIRQSLTAAGRAVPPTQLVSALIDTGATVSGIDGAVLQALGLRPTGTVNIGGVAGPNAHGLYTVDIHIPFGLQRLSLANRVVIGVQLLPPYKALLGRDLLAMMMLVYSGPAGTWTLAF